MAVVGLPLDIRTLILHCNRFTCWQPFITGLLPERTAPAALSGVARGSLCTTVHFKAERNCSFHNHSELQFSINYVKLSF